MSVTEVTRQGWGSRLMDSIKSVLFGLLLFALSFVVLFWNEGRAVQTSNSLDEGAGAVLPTPSDKVDSAREGKLVHMVGKATTDEILKDGEFNVSANAIRLLREVEMYQWKEKEHTEEVKEIGGSVKKTATYTYEKTWSEHPVDSSEFREAGHDNPAMNYQSKSFTAENVTFGAFKLTTSQVELMGKGEEMKIIAVPSGLENAQVASDGLFLGKTPGSPQIGDFKVNFRLIKPMTVSLIAQQLGSSFTPYQTKAGDALSLLVKGEQPAAAMFKQAQEDNVTMTWILRLVGFIMMLVGMVMVFKPISVFGDVIPLVGSALGAGLFVFALLVSSALSLTTIAIAWLIYRPLLGVFLLILAGGAMTLLVVRTRKSKAAKAAVAPAP